MADDPGIAELRRMIDEAGRIVVFTGAGISTESGIPDFRSPGGIWTRMQPIYFADFLASDEARRETWRRRFARLLERCADSLDLVALCAVQTMRVGRVSVQLDHSVRRHAGRLVQPVDVLRYHRRRLAAIDQGCDRAMSAVGFCLAHCLVGGEPPAPSLAPRLV